MVSLHADPTVIGEMLYTLTHLGLPVRHAVRSPWSIHFAVDEPRRLVYLSKIELLD